MTRYPRAPRLEMDRLPTLEQILSTRPMVSSHSRFDDDTWYMDGHTPGYLKGDFSISWAVRAHAPLINGLKYLAALLFLERDGRILYKHSTASTFNAGARYLLRFMSHHGFSSFAELDAQAISIFKQTLHIDLSEPHRSITREEVAKPIYLDVDPQSARNPNRRGQRAGTATGKGPSLPSEESNEDLTVAAAYYRLRALQHLFDHRELLENAGIPSIPDEPFPGSSVKTEADHIAAVAFDLIPPIPDQVALPILAEAYRLIQQPADDVIQLQRECLARMGRLGETSTGQGSSPINPAIEAFSFSEIDGKPWHVAIELGPKEKHGHLALRRLIRLIRDACVTVIFSGTGCRISEVCSLETADRPRHAPTFERRDCLETLPACVSTKKSKTGLHQHFFMHGKLSKNQAVPTDATWLIGSRPMDRADIEPVVLRAIRILEKLYAPWRSLIKDPWLKRQLLLTFRGPYLPSTSRGISAVTVGKLCSDLSDFVARDEVGLSRLAPLIAESPELAPYVHSNGRCIRPHQWRKTFAVYMMRIDERMLPALANHFKHTSIAITEQSYMPRDPSMIADAKSIEMRETARYFYERLRSAGGTFGKLDRTIDEFRSDIEKLVSDLPFEQAYPEIERVLLSHHLRIFHAEYGRCVIALNPDKARCHAVGGTSSWRQLQPNYETRTPSLCVGCENFSVSREHVGYWRRCYIEHQSAWLASGMSSDFFAIRKIADQAAKVLGALGAAVPEVRDTPPPK